MADSVDRVGRRLLVAVCLTPFLLALAPVASVAQEALTEEQKALHVLQRLGYGPRPGDVDRVLAMGIEAYIESQLAPERIESPRLEEKLEFYQLPLDSWEELQARDRPAVAMADRRRMSVQERAAQRGSDPRAGDVTTAERTRASLRNGAIAPDVTRMDRRWEDFEYTPTVVWHAIYSESQLEEILVDFWFNHFNITSGDPYIHTDYGENVIRRHALGRFEDLLVATARHPGMLIYLDNWLSTAPSEVVEERLAAMEPPNGEPKPLWLRRHREYLDMTAGLNENYGRELMELHTLGVDGGYTQADVQEVARAFTGWTLSDWRDGGHFEFSPLLHEDGDKTVLGQVIPSGGEEEGMQILHMLARHPSTAHFISTKLVRRFVADEPPPQIVEAAEQRFLESDGDIREVLRAIFYHPDFFAPEYYRAKMKKPVEAVVSALRAVDADIDVTFLGPSLAGGGNNNRAPATLMGERFRNHEAPDGYPDVAEAWVSTNALFQRIVFAMDVASESLRDTEVDLDAALRLFERAGYPEPTPEMIADARTLFAAMKREAEEDDGMMADDMTTQPAPGANDDDEDEGTLPDLDYDSLEAKVVAVALVLGSPDFQKR